MDSIAALQRRKEALKAQIEQEQTDLKQTFVEIRKEIEPAQLLKKAVTGILRPSKNKNTEAPLPYPGAISGPVGFLVDLLVKDPKWALLLKTIAPIAVKYLPLPSGKAKSDTKAEPIKTTTPKAQIYHRLRRGVSALRSGLRKKEPDVETTAPSPDRQIKE